MLDGIGAPAAFAIVQKNGDGLRARFAARRDNVADMARFRERAAAITDVEGLLKDRRTLQVVLEAFQLEGEIGKRGLLRKILTEPLAQENALANRFADPRWKQLAQAVGNGQVPPLAAGSRLQKLVDLAMTNRFEKAMGDSNPGMREALYFSRVGAQATTLAQLMSDPALTSVARGAIGMPDTFAALGYDQQKAILGKRLDMSVMADAATRQKMAGRYLALTAATTIATSSVSALFDGSGSAAGIAALAASRLSFSA